jgi:uncharacterized protein
MVIGEEESPLKFPCEYPVTFMGIANEEFEKISLALLEKYVGEIKESCVSRKKSREGKYISITVLLFVESRDVLELIYRDLSASDDVLMTL